MYYENKDQYRAIRSVFYAATLLKLKPPPVNRGPSTTFG